jgi:hypothetical protein
MRFILSLGRKAVTAAAIAAALLGAVSAPAAAKAPARPMSVSVACFYTTVGYYWTVLRGGSFCPSHSTIYIGGRFRTGYLWDYDVRP